MIKELELDVLLRESMRAQNRLSFADWRNRVIMGAVMFTKIVEIFFQWRSAAVNDGSGLSTVKGGGQWKKRLQQ